MALLFAVILNEPIQHEKAPNSFVSAFRQFLFLSTNRRFSKIVIVDGVGRLKWSSLLPN